MLAKAIRIAALKHGQAVDKGGQPFIGHPLRVMARVAAAYPQPPDYVLAAAVMHDVLEDTGTDYRELVHETGDYKAVYLTLILTRVDEHEGYFDYIERVKRGEMFDKEIQKSLDALMEIDDKDRIGLAGWAVCIKLEDLGDNLNPQRRVPGMRLPERYERAAAMLRA